MVNKDDKKGNVTNTPYYGNEHISLVEESIVSLFFQDYNELIVGPP